MLCWSLTWPSAPSKTSVSVSVVNNEGTVKNQPVKLGAVFGSLRAIVEGLKPGEAVIVSGLQQARPGAQGHGA